MRTFVNITKELRPLLVAATGQRVVTRVPDPRPAKFVQIRRIGGPADPNLPFDNALIDVFVWSDDEDDMWDTAHQVRDVILGLKRSQPLSAPVYSVTEFMGPAQSDDQTPGQPETPRVWFSVEITTRIKEE